MTRALHALITLPGLESFLVGECRRLGVAGAGDPGTVADGFITVPGDGLSALPAGTLRAVLEVVWSGPAERAPARLPPARALWFEGQLINGRVRCDAAHRAVALACGSEEDVGPRDGGPLPDMAAIVGRGGQLVVGRPLAWALEFARPYRAALMARSLNPAAARALAMAARARPGDIFLDPFCGSATVLAERALLTDCRLIGRDADGGAVDAARRTLAALAERVPSAAETAAAADIARGDARRLMLPSGSVTGMAANLPFGHRFGTHADNAALYAEAFSEAARVLAPAGRLAVLTTDRRHLRAALRACGPAFRVRSEVVVWLGGLLPTLAVYDRTGDPVQ